jgi:Arc/MetJ-type ribon-helix-helix transcriptional regulator
VVKTKIAVSLDARLVKEVDAQVKRHRYPSRSAAIDAALRNQAKAHHDAEYEAMLAQLDPDEERAWANERIRGEVFG